MIPFPHLIDDFEPFRSARVTIIMLLEMDTVLLRFVAPDGSHIPMSPPSVRPPRFGASRRRLGANTHSALGPTLFLLKVIDQPHVRIKAKNLRRLGNKIGKGIDVVINDGAIAIVD